MGILRKNKSVTKKENIVDNDTNTNKDIVEEKVVKEEKKTTTRKKSTKSKKDKKVYRVIMAKPSYFVIKKDGETVVINEANNYQRGQDILY